MMIVPFIRAVTCCLLNYCCLKNLILLLCLLLIISDIHDFGLCLDLLQEIDSFKIKHIENEQLVILPFLGGSIHIYLRIYF